MHISPENDKQLNSKTEEKQSDAFKEREKNILFFSTELGTVSFEASHIDDAIGVK